MAGSITVTTTDLGGGISKYSIAWVASGGGVVSATTLDLKRGYLVQAKFIPDGGGTQPSDQYDVTLVDANSVDILGGAGANLSNSASSIAELSLVLEGGAFTPTITNAGGSKGGTIILLVGLTGDAVGASSIAAANQATAAKQDTGNASLSSIDGKLPATLGPKADLLSLAVTKSVEDKAAEAAMSAKLPAALDGSGFFKVAVQSLVPGTAATNLGKAEDAGHTTGDTGVMALAVRNDTPAALAGTTLDYIPFTTSAYGGLWSTLVDNAGVVVDFSGITTVYRLPSSAGSTNGANVKALAGRVYWVRATNAAAYAVFVKLYNLAGSPTVGSSTIIETVCIPANSSFAMDYPAGLAFSTGIAVAITKLVADADTTAVLAADVLALSIGYT